MWDLILFRREFYYIFYMFLFYSFFGWIYESCFVSIQRKSIVNRGFLNGPIIPIYGLGALLMYLLFWDSRDNYLLVFLGGACLATILEYFTSLFMELLFHTRWWDYSTYRFNLKGRVCLMVSLFWGFLTLLMLQVFQPGIDLLITKFSRRTGEIAGFLIIPLITADIIVSAVNTKKFEFLLAKLHNLRQDILTFIAATKIYETGGELIDKLSGLRMLSMITEFRSFIDVKLHNVWDNKQISIQDELKFKELQPDIEIKISDFLKQYQDLKTIKAHIRLLRAFPSIKVNKREAALSDLKEKIAKKGVRTMSIGMKEEVTGRINNNLSGILRAAIVGILVLVQFGMVIALSVFLRGYTVYIYSFIQVLSIIIIIALVNDHRNASYKISWICIIAAFPITGHIMYMLWGNRGRRKIEQNVLKKLEHGTEFLEYYPEVMKQFAEKYPTKSRMTRYLELNNFPLYKNNTVSYYPMGEDVFEAISEEINKAEKFILINFFIVGEGVLWDKIHALLNKKLKSGVRVLFLYDDFGVVLRTPKNFKKTLESEGFEIRVFNPINKYTGKLYMNYRSHQKIIVIDGNIGFTGGINLADEYVNLFPRFGVWKDNAVRVEGDAVWGLTVTFLQMWEVSSAEGPLDYNPFRPSKSFVQNDVYCQVISDGPANNPRNPVENIYKQMIHYAKKLLYITTPYLIIEDDMRDSLVTAAISGIDVRIITPFIPDKKNVKILTNYNYGRLLESGVRIFEYTPGFIHAKTIISEASGIVGTINMDFRSFHLQYECGVWICDFDVIKTIKEDLLATMEQSKEITYEEWKHRPLYIKIYQLILNLFSTLM